MLPMKEIRIKESLITNKYIKPINGFLVLGVRGKVDDEVKICFFASRTSVVVNYGKVWQHHLHKTPWAPVYQTQSRNRMILFSIMIVAAPSTWWSRSEKLHDVVADMELRNPGRKMQLQDSGRATLMALLKCIFHTFVEKCFFSSIFVTCVLSCIETGGRFVQLSI